MTITLEIDKTDMDLPAQDFHTRYLVVAFSQVKNALDRYPNEPILVEISLNGGSDLMA